MIQNICSVFGCDPSAHQPEREGGPYDRQSAQRNLGQNSGAYPHHALPAIADREAGVFQLATLNAAQGKVFTRIGYFDDWEALAKIAAQATLTTRVEAVWVNLQEIHPDCLHRAWNKLRNGAKAISGADVIRYRHFLIDGDRDGIKGISSSAVEKERIRQELEALREFLIHELGWPDPAFAADSSNAYHCAWRIDLPVTPQTQDLLRRAYRALEQRFGSDSLKIDTSLADPNQLIKLYGTKTRKGDDTPDRPHRWSRLLQSYVTEPVRPDQLEQLAALQDQRAGAHWARPLAGVPTDTPRPLAWQAGTPDQVEAWAKHHGLSLSHARTGRPPPYRGDLWGDLWGSLLGPATNGAWIVSPPARTKTARR